MDEQTIHVVAHYNAKTDQVYVNVFEDGETADKWSAKRREEKDIDALLHKVLDLPEDFADGTVAQWERNE
jgi:K+/H+ antiporter YhaU regulatory subunit KhtT